MKIEYFPETNSLYIELTDRTGADTREIEDGIVLDIDENGHAVGLDIDQASKHSTSADSPSPSNNSLRHRPRKKKSSKSARNETITRQRQS